MRVEFLAKGNHGSLFNNKSEVLTTMPEQPPDFNLQQSDKKSLGQIFNLVMLAVDII